jgi:SpoVK/Ycf46/Vps4 family AAA+-type ATPase
LKERGHRLQNQIKPHHVLLQIGEQLKESCGKNQFKPSKKRGQLLGPLCQSFSDSGDFEGLKLTQAEILVIAQIWYAQLKLGTAYFTSIEILESLLAEGSNPIDHFELIIGLLEKQVLYTSKKLIIHSMEINEPIKRIRYTKRSLLEENISLHHNIVNLLLEEPEEVNDKLDVPYESNKEYLSDWFAYTEKLRDLRYYDFRDTRFGEEMDESTANDMLEVMKWKHRIDARLKLTEEVFPLQDVVDEYALDENETTMLAYLVREELDNSSVDIEELVKLISTDQHDLYKNRQYLAIDSNLVRNGIVELSENMFLRSTGSEVKTAPDIMKQIILDTPVNDDERLSQILKGNDIFTLIDPNYDMDDLILADELKQTIVTSISKYHENIHSVLSSWQLFNGQMETVGRVKKESEEGLLMLLHGPSGSGKTFASGAIARHLGKKLLVTDISRLQSKWVGDSEKNVQRLFTIFERIVRRVENPPVLLLNEADQFLSTRLSETHSSVDQMQNSMQNLFLEGFERLRGVMIATTNLQENMDSAFSRRFHLKLELPVPGCEEREKLWELHLPPTIPRSRNLDIRKLSHDYVLTGGQIKIIIQNAATEAASRKGKSQILMLSDLIKYCELEGTNGANQKPAPIGFAIA